MEKKYEHIFFDLDRTLWHFDENSKQVLLQIFDQFKLVDFIPSFNAFREKYIAINEELWAEYREGKILKEELRSRRFFQTFLYFGKEDEAMAEEVGFYYIENSPRQTLLLPYAIEVLDYLKAKYQLHIITNGFEEVQHIKMDCSGLNGYFNQLIFSEKVGVKKPHPLIFKKAMKLAGAKPDNSLMIGDDYYADIYGAQRVGMDNVYFNFYQIQHSNKTDKEIFCLSELKNWL